MAWDLKNDRPIYKQLLEIIELKIITGEYSKGDKLMSVRELAAEAAVNPNTMQKALTELERTGLVITERATGRYVTEDEQMIREARDDLAREQIELFLANMRRLGIDKEELLELLSKQ